MQVIWCCKQERSEHTLFLVRMTRLVVVVLLSSRMVFREDNRRCLPIDLYIYIYTVLGRVIIAPAHIELSHVKIGAIEPLSESSLVALRVRSMPSLTLPMSLFIADSGRRLAQYLWFGTHNISTRCPRAACSVGQTNMIRLPSKPFGDVDRFGLHNSQPSVGEGKRSISHALYGSAVSLYVEYLQRLSVSPRDLTESGSRPKTSLL